MSGRRTCCGAFEVAFGAAEILGHHAEVDVFRAEDVADLVNHFVDAHVAAGVAGAVVAGEEQFQFFAAIPALPAAQHPVDACEPISALTQASRMKSVMRGTLPVADLRRGIGCARRLRRTGQGLAG